MTRTGGLGMHDNDCRTRTMTADQAMNDKDYRARNAWQGLHDEDCKARTAEHASSKFNMPDISWMDEEHNLRNSPPCRPVLVTMKCSLSQLFWLQYRFYRL